LEEALAANHGGSENLIAAVPADLTPHGSFGEEWLVVTKERLLVFQPNGGQPTPRLDLPVAELKSPATDSLIGGAALHATLDGQVVEIVRYTNARQRQFSRVAKYLGDVAKYHEALTRGEEVQ